MHESLCDYLLELARNAVEAAATRVDITVEETEGTLRASVADNGRGMSEAERARCLDPFGTAAGKHPERRTGLGLPLLEAALVQRFQTSAVPLQPASNSATGALRTNATANATPSNLHRTPPRLLPPNSNGCRHASENASGTSRAKRHFEAYTPGTYR